MLLYLCSFSWEGGAGKGRRLGGEYGLASRAVHRVKCFDLGKPSQAYCLIFKKEAVFRGVRVRSWYSFREGREGGLTCANCMPAVCFGRGGILCTSSRRTFSRALVSSVRGFPKAPICSPRFAAMPRRFFCASGGGGGFGPACRGSDAGECSQGRRFSVAGRFCPFPRVGSESWPALWPARAWRPARPCGAPR